MFRNIPLLIFVGTTLLFSSCKKEDVAPIKNEVVVPVLDKEVRIPFPFVYAGTNSRKFDLLPSSYHLIKFNKSNYSDINSATLYVQLATDNQTDTVEVDLFNVTDNIAINNTVLQASTPKPDRYINYELAQTGNILRELPGKEVDLAIRIKSRKGQYVYIASPLIILKRL